MAELTPAHLRAIMPNIPQRDEYTEFEACCATMRRFHINTKRRAAAWFMNVAKESGELYYTEEIASGAAYEGRRDLGNTQPGDGVRFKGRGYIQITGRGNYTTIDEDLDIDCVRHPEILEQMPHRWTTAGYFWEHMARGGTWNLNEIADTGDYARTVLGVRGGPDPDRHRYYHRAMSVLPDDLEIPGGPEAGGQERADLYRVLVSVKGESEQAIFHHNPTAERVASQIRGRVDLPADKSVVVRETLDTGDRQGWTVVVRGRFTHKPTAVRVARQIRRKAKLPPDKSARIVQIGGQKKQDPPKAEPEPEPFVWPAFDPGPAPNPNAASYVARHPTRYFFVDSVEKVARLVIEKFPGISISTYEEHPPPFPHYERVSLDVWDDRGRGFTLDPTIGRQVFDFLFNLPGAPYIEWAIYMDEMWVRGSGWQGSPPGPADSDPKHRGHIHISYGLRS